jgi:hypothetical protein
MKAFSPHWTALSREAAIAGQSVGAGLTALRKATFQAEGLYSQAFFSLSIGLERMLKLIFVVDNMMQNGGRLATDQALHGGRLATDQALRRLGHDLEKLSTHAEGVRRRLPQDNLRYALPPGDVAEAIVGFLSRFAKSTRYYNLDYLSGTNHAGSDDPIKEWFERVGGVILNKHYTRAMQKRDEEWGEMDDSMLGSVTKLLYTAEDGTLIDNWKMWSRQIGKVHVLQLHGTLYSARVVRYHYETLFELVHAAHSSRLEVPHLYEFFFPFLNDDAYLKRRRTFMPLSQAPGI